MTDQICMFLGTVIALSLEFTDIAMDLIQLAGQGGVKLLNPALQLHDGLAGGLLCVIQITLEVGYAFLQLVADIRQGFLRLGEELCIPFCRDGVEAGQGTLFLLLCIQHRLVKCLLVLTFQLSGALLQLLLQLLQALALEVCLPGSVFRRDGGGGQVAFRSGNPVGKPPLQFGQPGIQEIFRIGDSKHEVGLNLLLLLGRHLPELLQPGAESILHSLNVFPEGSHLRVEILPDFLNVLP